MGEMEKADQVVEVKELKEWKMILEEQEEMKKMGEEVVDQQWPVGGEVIRRHYEELAGEQL